MISDSNLTPDQAFAQNPASVCPEDILKNLGLITVEYLGFDDHVHVGQIVVAHTVIAEVDAFFRHALESRFPIDKVVPAAAPEYEWDDEKLMAGNITSGFNYRKIAGSAKLSLHSTGHAFDVNPAQNPYIRYQRTGNIVEPEGASWDKNNPGTLYADHPLVKMMEGFGWEWGGRWLLESGRTDYMHFQKTVE